MQSVVIAKSKMMLLLLLLVVFLWTTKCATDHEHETKKRSILSRGCQLGIDGECIKTHHHHHVVYRCTNQYDSHDCENWAQKGECESNPRFMIPNCQKSCNACGKTLDEFLSEIRNNNRDTDNDAVQVGIPQNVSETKFGVKQTTDVGRVHKADVLMILQDTVEYMMDKVLKDPIRYPSHVVEKCKNHNQFCAFWKALGECTKNPGYMTIQCSPTCQTCHDLDVSTRCERNSSEPQILEKAGDLDRLFERLISPQNQQYEPQIWSKPSYSSLSSSSSPPREGPWIVTLDKFLTDEECDRLVLLGHREGFEQSTTTFLARTSTNCWCQEQCPHDPLAERVMAKISNATGIPSDNAEYMQLTRYQVGQYYTTHTDYISHQAAKQEGLRILTVYLYLSDVEQGGGTEFPHLEMTVMPKKGRALIWSSVLNENPNKQDSRTDHQALPVLEGLKYGANIWLHQRDFKKQYKKGCH